MAAPHALSGELIDIRPFGPGLERAVSHALVRSDHLEVFRMVLPAGRGVPEHHFALSSTVQCLEGEVEVEVGGRLQLMRPGGLLYLAGGEPHTMRAVEDASLLVTMLVERA